MNGSEEIVEEIVTEYFDSDERYSSSDSSGPENPKQNIYKEIDI